MPYHINRRGVAAPCRAAKGNCPLGSAFDSKQSASAAATKETQAFLASESASARQEQVEELVDKGAYGTIEKTVSSYDANNLATANEHLAAVRKEYKEIDNSTRNDLIYKSQEINKKREERMNELKEKAPASKEQVEKLNKAKLELQEAYNQRNKLTPSNYQKLIMDKNSEVYGTEQAIKKNMDKVIEDDPRMNELKEQSKANRRKSNAVEYILRSKKKTSKTAGITKIEKEYQERIAGDEKIMKKVGVTKVIKQSKDMNFGNNPLPDELVVDKKGKIANLYIEHTENKGELLKVVKIHDSDTGNLELSNGEKITMQQSNNWRSDPYAKAHDSWKFYTTPPKGRDKYKGYNQVKINVIDTGY